MRRWCDDHLLVRLQLLLVSAQVLGGVLTGMAGLRRRCDDRLPVGPQRLAGAVQVVRYRHEDHLAVGPRLLGGALQEFAGLCRRLDHCVPAGPPRRRGVLGGIAFLCRRRQDPPPLSLYPGGVLQKDNF